MTLRGLDTTKSFVVVTGDGSDPGVLALLRAEPAELEAVVGTTVEFADDVPAGTPRWVVESDPGAAHVGLAWDPRTQELRSVVRQPGEHVDSVNLLHSLAHSASTRVDDDVCTTQAEAFERIRAEVAGVFPSLGLRGLDWEQICDRYADIVFSPPREFVNRAQQWVAELGDAHTALHTVPRPYHHSPYAAAMTPLGALLTHVPRVSEAARAGVVAGWTVEVDEPDRWLRTTGATARQHRQVAARRALAMTEDTRTFSARSPTGAQVSWTEYAVALPDVELDVTHARIRLNGFTDQTAAHVDDALDALRGRPHVTVDLRGNCGGSLLAAVDVRRRFLREETTIGTIRFTDGRGGLGEPVTVVDRPVGKSDDSPRDGGVRVAGPAWTGTVTFLTDAMTYSAAEDLLWGLQGLDHVSVHGSTTGGGSGRPHTRRITRTLSLTVSTALTYDRDGRCLELNGLVPEAPLDVDAEAQAEP